MVTYCSTRDLGVNLDYTARTTGGTIENSAGDNADLPLATQTLAGLMSPGDKAKVDNALNLDWDAKPDSGEIKRVDNGDVIVTAPLVTNTLAGLMSPKPEQQPDALANLDALYLADAKDFSAWNGGLNDYNKRPDASPPGAALRGDVVLNTTGSFNGDTTISSGLKAKIFNPQDLRPGDKGSPWRPNYLYQMLIILLILSIGFISLLINSYLLLVTVRLLSNRMVLNKVPLLSTKRMTLKLT